MSFTKERPPRVKAKPIPNRFPLVGVRMQQPGEAAGRQIEPAHVPPREPASRIRESARGEQCLVRLPGVCTHDPATVIWSHARWGAAGRGKGIKALDLAGAYCCTACDAAYDGQRPAPGMSRDEIDTAWCHGHFRSLVRLHEKGLL